MTADFIEPLPEDRRAVVAVLNTSPDTIDMLRDVLQQAGFVVVTGYTHAIRDGKMDIEQFLRTHKPQVIVYDIAPPYDPNWRLFEHLRATVMHDYRFVLTTTNPIHVERLAGRDQRVYEVVGKPEDLDQIVRATREAARARDTR